MLVSRQGHRLVNMQCIRLTDIVSMSENVCKIFFHRTAGYLPVKWDSLFSTRDISHVLTAKGYKNIGVIFTFVSTSQFPHQYSGPDESSRLSYLWCPMVSPPYAQYAHGMCTVPVLGSVWGRHGGHAAG